MLAWTDEAWQQYLEWQEIDKKKFKKLNLLIKEALRTPYEGTGRPEPLKGNFSGYWSRRIDEAHRLVYRVTDAGDMTVIQCRGHYLDK